MVVHVIFMVDAPAVPEIPDASPTTGMSMAATMSKMRRIYFSPDDLSGEGDLPPSLNVRRLGSLRSVCPGTAGLARTLRRVCLTRPACRRQDHRELPSVKTGQQPPRGDRSTRPFGIGEVSPLRVVRRTGPKVVHPVHHQRCEAAVDRQLLT